MKLLINIIRIVAITTAMSAVLFALACAGGGDPKNVYFNIRVAEGHSDMQEMEANKSDSISIKVTGDTDGKVHLHGYDIELDIEPGQVATMEFEAVLEGRFNLTFHGVHIGHGHSDSDGHREDEMVISTLVVNPR
jgi:hypothetical protein